MWTNELAGCPWLLLRPLCVMFWSMCTAKLSMAIRSAFQYAATHFWAQTNRWLFCRYFKAGGLPEQVVDLLSSNYKAMAQTANLLAEWLILAGQYYMFSSVPILQTWELIGVHMLNRGVTNRENLCRVGYQVRKLRSGPGRVYPMRVI